jgi:hypothetical protein
MPTKAEYQQTNDEMRTKIAAYEEIGTPEQVREKLAAAADAVNTNAMIRKLLA